MGWCAWLPLYGGGFLPAFAQLTCFYYVAAATLHCVVPRLFPVARIQKRQRGFLDVPRDATYSLGPLAVKAAVWTICEALHRNGYTLTYSGPIDYGVRHVFYMAFCVLVLDYAHDTWFYWTHRLLHWRPLYIHIHYIHHKSVVPSAFTGYSFHVAEAALVFANEVLMCFLLPMHMALHRLYHLFTTLIHEGGHAGYEISPCLPHLANVVMIALRGISHNFKGFNTVQHHDMHHRYPSKHFSLYFTHWDRLCGTLHPDYDALVSRPP